MPTTISGADTWRATFDVPADGDARNAASVNTALEALADRTRHLYLHHARGTHDKSYVDDLGAIAPVTWNFWVSESWLEAPVSGSRITLTLADVDPGDTCLVTVSLMVWNDNSGAGLTHGNQLRVVDMWGTPVPGMRAYVATDDLVIQHITMSGIWTAPNPTAAPEFILQGRVESAVANNELHIVSLLHFHVLVIAE